MQLGAPPAPPIEPAGGSANAGIESGLSRRVTFKKCEKPPRERATPTPNRQESFRLEHAVLSQLEDHVRGFDVTCTGSGSDLVDARRNQHDAVVGEVRMHPTEKNSPLPEARRHDFSHNYWGTLAVFRE